MPGWHRPQREEEMVGAIQEHPCAEDHPSGQYELLHGRSPAVWATLARPSPRLRAHGEHRAVAGDEGHGQQDIAGQHPAACEHAPEVPFRQGRIPPEHAERDRHAHQEHERGKEAQQDADPGDQLYGFDEVEQVAVKQRKEHLVRQRMGGVISRLRIDVIEMLQAGRNHPACVPESHGPDHVLHVSSPCRNAVCRLYRAVYRDRFTSYCR